MILTFLYHRVHSGKYSNTKDMMGKHLSYLVKKHRFVVPGDATNWFRFYICLTFDDAYFDFYHNVYPLLKKYNIKAVLAIPIRFIQEKTTLPAEVRLSVPYSAAMKNDNYITKVPFCTWEEINEMVNSGHVHIASHSYTHESLLKPYVDLDQEIVQSKLFLEKKLNIKISTFIYPLGQFNQAIHKRVQINYKYIMRIGSTWNFSWKNLSKIIYRVISDSLIKEDEHLKKTKHFSYAWFYILNSIRKR